MGSILAGSAFGTTIESSLKFKPESVNTSGRVAELEMSFKFDEVENIRFAKAAARRLVEQSGALNGFQATFSFSDSLVFSLTDDASVEEKQKGFGQCLSAWVLNELDDEEAAKVYLAIRSDDGSIDTYSDQFRRYISENDSCHLFEQTLPDEHVLNTYLSEYIRNDHFGYNQGFLTEYSKLYAKPLRAYNDSVFSKQAKDRLLKDAKNFADTFAATGRKFLNFDVVASTINGENFSKGRLFQSVLLSTNSLDDIKKEYEKILEGKPNSLEFDSSLKLANRVVSICGGLVTDDDTLCQSTLSNTDFYIFTITRNGNDTKFLAFEE